MASPPIAAARALGPTLVGFAVLVLVANRWGQSILDDGVRLRILAPPIIGRFRFGPPGGVMAIALPLVAGGLLVRHLPRFAAAIRWRRLLILSAVAAAAWAISLALVDGPSGLTRPMELPGHYLLDIDRVGSPGAFLRGFTDNLGEYGTHIRSHPPGLVLLLWAMDRIGLGGSGWAAALVIGGGASAVPAVLITTRELAGEALARRALPFSVLAPAALYVASTGDALFAGVVAWGVAATVVATGSNERRRDVLASVGGAVFGLALLLSYGAAIALILPVVVIAVRRSWRVGVTAALAGSGVLALAAVAGFWWLEGLFATRLEYLDSVASVRPYGYFLVANLAALAIIIGPATLAGIRRLTWPLALVVGPALAMVAIADVSGMSKGEVERIWLPFAVFLLPAGALASDDEAQSRYWLGAQVLLAVLVTAFVRTHW